MGGGRNIAVYKPPRVRSAEELRKNAQESIKKTESRLKTNGFYPEKNVFISFHHKDENFVKLFRHQASNDRFNMSFRDYSAKERLEEPWKEKIKTRISQSSTTFVMIGEETHKRPAVDFEIKESYRQGKRVAGIRIYKDANHKIPEEMKKNNAPILNWTLGDINEILDY